MFLAKWLTIYRLSDVVLVSWCEWLLVWTCVCTAPFPELETCVRVVRCSWLVLIVCLVPVVVCALLLYVLDLWRALALWEDVLVIVPACWLVVWFLWCVTVVCVFVACLVPCIWEEPLCALESVWAQAAAVIPNKTTIERISFFITSVFLNSNNLIPTNSMQRIATKKIFFPAVISQLWLF